MPSGPSQQGHYLIAASQRSFYVRVVGLATMTNSVHLQEVLQHSRSQGFRRFIFDLGACSGLDSTFMGILLGVAMGENGGPSPGDEEGSNGGDGPATVVLVNASSYLAGLLAGVGIDRVVKLHGEPVEFPPVGLQRLVDMPPDPLRRIRSMVTAHENLVRLGGQNVIKFASLLDALRRELGEGGDLA